MCIRDRRTAVRRAAVLAGFDEDAGVSIARYPGSSLLDILRPKASSQPVAASLPDAVASLLGQSILGVVGEAERSLTGAKVLWLGNTRL